ncbi:MAG: aminotransferase class V-fold PLP-dependent enzyme [Acidimicrobiales bacterium]|nr:aminotransferase class V-fold PLP-dependent enzyme [Acidimicrobiales bacterium]
MSGLPLEPSAADRDELSRGVLEFLHRWIDERDGAPASWPEPDGALLDSLLQAPTDDGVPLDQLLDAIGRAADTGFDTAGGAMLSYIPSGGIYTAALGGLLGAVTNQYTGGAHASPGMTAIEESVVRWMVELFGLPTTGGGVLLSGGSIANQVAVVTARSRLGDDFRDGVVYCSTRTHHSVEKAARIAGINTDRIRLIASDENRRLEMDALARQVAQDRADGLRPMLIVANAGTTDTGAIDPLDACADIAAESGAWFHADAAYGGFFQLTERGRTRMRGIERADSITVDAHKSLFLPFGVGGLLVRERATVVEAHQGRGAYMQDVPSTDLPHYMEMGPELTRPNRGLQVWLALNLHGIQRFRDELDRMLDLAEHAAIRLASIPGVDVLDDPELSVVAFRASSGDDATRRLLDVLVTSREVHVSSTTIDGRVYVRLAFLSQRTTTAIVDRAIDIIASASAD